MSTTDDDLKTGNAPAEGGGGWTFDESVAESFEDMLERSIPQYDVMRRAVTDAACWFADRVRSPVIVDLGASRGSAIAPIVDRLGASARYRALEISEPMIAVMRERFAREIELGLISVEQHDLRRGFAPGIDRPAVVLSVLTLQFVPIEYRQRVLRDIYNSFGAYGGAFIWVEKVLGATAALDELEVDLYYGLKRGNGYSQEAIDRKRLSLEGVLVPLTARFNEDLLRQAGFREYDVVWAWQNFRAWIAIRD